MTDYLEGALSRRDRKRFERHLAGCPHCTEYLAQMRVTVAATTRPASTPAPTTATTGHLIVRSFEPGEDWFFNYVTGEFFDGPSLAAPASHPASQPVPGPAGQPSSSLRPHRRRIVMTF